MLLGNAAGVGALLPAAQPDMPLRVLAAGLAAAAAVRPLASQLSQMHTQVALDAAGFVAQLAAVEWDVVVVEAATVGWLRDVASDELALGDVDATALPPLLLASAAADVIAAAGAHDLALTALETGAGAAADAQALRAHALRGRTLRRQINALRDAVAARDERLYALDQHAIVSITDVNGTIVHTNAKFEQISGYSDGELIGANHRVLKSGLHPPEFYDALWGEISAGRTWHGTICNRRKDGSHYWVESTIVPLLDADELPYGYVSVRTDVTDLKRSQSALQASEAELRAARDLADQANRAKSDFLSSMSHELRTPLNAVLGFAQLLQLDRRNALTPMQLNHVDHIARAGEHLLRLINEVLDLTRIESGRIELSLEPIEPARLLADCLTLFQPLAQQQGVALRLITLPAGLPPLLADYTRAKQVLLNLVSNAVKYNRAGGWVSIELARDGAFVTVSVADNGPGIERELQQRLFEPFQRLGQEASSVEGTGIGLHIARRLMEQMGGSIGFDSEAGVGSRFWARFPTAPSTPVTTRSSTSPAPFAPLPKEGAHVLYVEDNPANQKLMEFIIRELGALRLTCLHTAELALAAVQGEVPDVVIMDINLPGMSGIEALRRLRADERTRRLPVIALSANASDSAVRKGLEAGFNAYLTKPVRVEDVYGALRDALGLQPQ